MRRTTTALAMALFMVMPAAAVADDEVQQLTAEGGTAERLPAEDARARGGWLDSAAIVQEFDFDGNVIEDGDRIGWSLLLRRPRGLKAVARVKGLRPGGVYTFWWVVVQRDGTFPDDIFAASGGAAVVGSNGRATVAVSAELGQPGITGFTPDGVNEIEFASLNDPLGATVRIEIAYHGQADDAGDELPVWLADFWTGSACPPETPNPNPAQPHCPVYYASTHQ